MTLSEACLRHWPPPLCTFFLFNIEFCKKIFGDFSTKQNDIFFPSILKEWCHGKEFLVVPKTVHYFYPFALICIQDTVGCAKFGNESSWSTTDLFVSKNRRMFDPTNSGFSSCTICTVHKFYALLAPQ
jgi:hypothetical protein